MFGPRVYNSRHETGVEPVRVTVLVRCMKRIGAIAEYFKKQWPNGMFRKFCITFHNSSSLSSFEKTQRSRFCARVFPFYSYGCGYEMSVSALFLKPTRYILRAFFGCVLAMPWTSAHAIESFDTGIQVDKNDIRVFYQDKEASAFAEYKNGSIYFQVPFPDDKSEFELKIIERRTGDILLENIYEVVDNRMQFVQVVDVGTSTADEELTVKSVSDSSLEASQQFTYTANTQFDLSGFAERFTGSDFTEVETAQDGESDLLASFSSNWSSQYIELGGELEAVHRSNPESAVRFGGPRADLAKMSSSLLFSGPSGTAFQLQAGDVSLESPNTLVNAGMASRGFVIGFSTPNDRFSWSVGRMFGQDIVGTVKGPLGLGNESYRVVTNYRFNVVNTENLVWDLSVANLRAKRNTDDDFGIGSSNSGERNDVWGASSQLAVLDGRVSLSFSFAHSEYDNPSELNSDNIPDGDGFEVFDPGVTSGSAYSHRVIWEVLRNEEANQAVTLELATEKADPFYRSIQGQSTADREQWSLFTSFYAGALNGRLGSTQYQNNLDKLISIHTLDEAVHQAELSLSLLEMIEDDSETNQSFRRMVPSSVSLYATIEELKTLNGDVIILAPVIDGFDFMDQTTETVGMSATWDGQSHSTSVDVSYSFMDNDQRERATADRRDVSYSVAHSINKEKWSITGNLSLNTSDDLDNASRSQNQATQWGVSGSYSADIGINWTAAFESGLNELHYLLSDENEDSDSNTLSLSMDFGTWLAERLSLPTDPSMTLRWHRSENENRSDFFSSDQTSESITFNVGVSF